MSVKKGDRRSNGEVRLKEIEAEAFFENVIVTPGMKGVFAEAEEIALKSNFGTVMIYGESGTGKEMLAKWIHLMSQRAEKPFEVVHIAGYAENLLESELFGHVKGAFTGAIRPKKGILKKAHEGTVFLDEVSDIPFLIQVKLLRFLESKTLEGEFIRRCRKVGSTEETTIDVRIIGTSHTDLKILVKEGKFRKDFYFRLKHHSLQLPPLRERQEDILILAHGFLSRYRQALSRGFKEIDVQAQRKLLIYPWPGNVRELDMAMLKVSEFADEHDRVLELRHLVFFGKEGSFKRDLLVKREFDNLFTGYPCDHKKVVEKARFTLIRGAIRKAQGNFGKAARLIGISRASIRKAVEDHPEEFEDVLPLITGFRKTCRYTSWKY